jgi:VanZ family protein
MYRWLTPHSKVRTWILLAWWLAMFLLTHLPGIDQWKPKSGWPIKDPDKLVHFVLFGTWAALWVWVLAGHGRRLTWAASLYLIAGAALYAAFDEVTQGPVGRTPDVDDWLLDMIGCLFGLAIAFFLQRRRYKARSTLTT